MNQEKPVKVTISLVTWNSEKDLPVFFESLDRQTFTDFEVIAVDNNSADKTVEILKSKKTVSKLIVNESNKGYTGAHNQAIQLSKSKYILVANPDIKLAPGFLETAIKTIESNDSIGSLGGKLLKLNTALKPGSNSDIIDSTGLRAYKNRRFSDRGEGEEDRGQYNAPEEVFGVSGALVLYRKAALLDVGFSNGDYFDEMYFCYREDIDLAWRLRHRKWISYYNPESVAWHRRTAFGNDDKSDLDTLRNRGKKSKTVNALSYRNHLYTLIKNERCSNLFWWWPWIFIYELKKYIYIILFEPQTFIRSFDICKNISKLIYKRSYILGRSRATSHELRKWFK